MAQNKMSVKASKNKPFGKVKAWPVTVAAWKNETDDGKEYLSFSIQRTYKDKDGNYQNTQSYRREDLLKLAVACQEAFKNSELPDKKEEDE